MLKNLAFCPCLTLNAGSLGLKGRSLGLTGSELRNSCCVLLYLLAAALASLSACFLAFMISSYFMFFSGKLLLPRFLKLSYFIAACEAFKERPEDIFFPALTDIRLGSLS
jgi:hypothetical protein